MLKNRSGNLGMGYVIIKKSLSYASGLGPQVHLTEAIDALRQNGCGLKATCKQALHCHYPKKHVPLKFESP